MIGRRDFFFFHTLFTFFHTHAALLPFFACFFILFHYCCAGLFTTLVYEFPYPVAILGQDYQKYIYNLVSHCLPCNSSHNVVNHAIGIMEAFSDVNIVAKLLAKLQEVESSCRCTYNGVVLVRMWMKTRLESTKIVSSTITSE